MTSDVVRWTRNDDKEKSKHCCFVNEEQCRDRSNASDLSDRYDTSLINLRLSQDRQHKQRDQQQPKERDQQQQQILSFNEILVIMSRFCSYGRSSSTRSSSDGVIIAASTMTPRYRRSLFLKFFTFIFVILQVNVFCSSFFVIVAAATDSSSNSSSGRNDGSNSANGHFTPTWAVHIPNGDENGKADRVARDHGFMNLGKIFDDHYHFHHRLLAKRSLTGSHPHQQRLEDDHRVHWSKQQRVKSRQKRDFIRMRPSRTSSQTMSLVSRVQLNDPKWPQMWYLNRGNGLDMNVIPAWEQGITGKGVVVTILDDGLESDHPDLEHNYDPKASYDVNSHDDDPMPHYDMTDSNRHGTRCAGEVAATANNSLCAVGIAFGASVGGVRMLDGDVTDAVEARSLSLNPQHIDIYSASWGPDDDGKTVDGPGELATRAFIEGVTKGREGKGSIFIWASGNGGRELDNCNCDGYTNSIWTLSISSATEEGLVPWYSEKCSSTLATTYSSGAQNEKQVVTTDLHHSCTTSHTGTSASAPLAAGIVALVLEANRNLTWRDLQHIVVRTAKPGNLKDPTWSKNGVGRRVSHSFGYGLMDASAMVKVARIWQTVPEQQRCEINAPHVDQAIPPKRYITLQLTVNHCNGVNFLEHVQAKISLTSQRRGDIQIFLQSPSGTRVTLLTSRLHDVSRSGFNQWPFMSVHTWGESPRGNWLLEIHNEGRFMGHAALKGWSLIFYGTALPIDKNDPISVRPTASSSTNSSPSSSLIHHQVFAHEYPIIQTSNSNHYPISVLTKQPNSKVKPNPGSNGGGGGGGVPNGGRKQPQHHQINAYGVVLTSPKKNGKNSKNNSQSNGGGGKANGKNGGSKSPTNRPINSQPTGQQSSKNNFYRISTSSATSGKPSTGSMRPSSSTPRPKFTQQTGYNMNFGSSQKSEKPVRIQEKVAIKAPKQIKDNNAYGLGGGPLSTVLPPPLTPVHSRYDPNPRIPKLFQQYEKIEQIFPEFHPYTGTVRDNSSPTKPAPNKKQYPYYGGGVGPLSETSSNNNKGGSRSSSVGGTSAVVVTNPKPSRENSKKFSSSQTFQNEERDKQTDRIYIPNRKNTKAQVTQWDLIFFGTDLPAQPDDPVQNVPGRFGQYGGDLENNFLGPDPETMSGQWRDNQQIGESHVDVQRTTSNDETSTACRNYVADQRCIECDPTTFLYNGRCWSLCPEQSYMIPEVPYSAENGRLQQLLSLRSIINSSSSLSIGTLRKRVALHGAFQKKCAACHTTCLKCRGSDPRDCLQCLPGHELTIISSDESYCYAAPSAAKFPGNYLSRATGDQGDPKVQTVFQKLDAYWSVIVVTITGLVLVVVATMVTKDYLSRRRKLNDYSYDRIALNATNEETQSLKEANDADETESIRLEYARSKRDIAGTSKTTDRRISVESCSSESDLY